MTEKPAKDNIPAPLPSLRAADQPGHARAGNGMPRHPSRQGGVEARNGAACSLLDAATIGAKGRRPGEEGTRPPDGGQAHRRALTSPGVRQRQGRVQGSRPSEGVSALHAHCLDRNTPARRADLQGIRKGRNAAQIAKRTLGSEERWTEIDKLNPGLRAKRSFPPAR